MTLRELAVEDWGLLEPYPLYRLLPFANPEFARVFVVVNDDGAIIGVQGVLSWLHAEGLFVAPEHRGKAAVARLLRHAVLECLGDAQGVMTGADTPEMEGILRKMGAIELPMRPFYLPLKPLPEGIESHMTEED